MSSLRHELLQLKAVQQVKEKCCERKSIKSISESASADAIGMKSKIIGIYGR